MSSNTQKPKLVYYRDGQKIYIDVANDPKFRYIHDASCWPPMYVATWKQETIDDIFNHHPGDEQMDLSDIATLL